MTFCESFSVGGFNFWNGFTKDNASRHERRITFKSKRFTTGTRCLGVKGVQNITMKKSGSKKINTQAILQGVMRRHRFVPCWFHPGCLLGSFAADRRPFHLHRYTVSTDTQIITLDLRLFPNLDNLKKSLFRSLEKGNLWVAFSQSLCT